MTRESSELTRRIAAGAGAAVVALGALTLGGLAWWLLAAAVALVGYAEWVRLVASERSRATLAAVVLGGALALAAPAAWGSDRSTVALLLILCLLLLLVPRTARAAGGAAYLGLGAIAPLFLRAQPNGIALTVWTLLVVWSTDTGAFFAGRAIGGPRLAPAISPGKTWAGLAGGAVAALAVGAGAALVGRLPAAAFWLGAPFAVVAQAGDLFESALKRRAGVKDSGAVLPGHGGVLDRVDGLLPVAILVAALQANGSF